MKISANSPFVCYMRNQSAAKESRQSSEGNYTGRSAFLPNSNFYSLIYSFALSVDLTLCPPRYTWRTIVISRSLIYKTQTLCYIDSGTGFPVHSPLNTIKIACVLSITPLISFSICNMVFQGDIIQYLFYLCINSTNFNQGK